MCRLIVSGVFVPILQDTATMWCWTYRFYGGCQLFYHRTMPSDNSISSAVFGVREIPLTVSSFLRARGLLLMIALYSKPRKLIPQLPKVADESQKLTRARVVIEWGCCVSCTSPG